MIRLRSVWNTTLDVLKGLGVAIGTGYSVAAIVMKTLNPFSMVFAKTIMTSFLFCYGIGTMGAVVFWMISETQARKEIFKDEDDNGYWKQYFLMQRLRADIRADVREELKRLETPEQKEKREKQEKEEREETQKMILGIVIAVGAISLLVSVPYVVRLRYNLHYNKLKEHYEKETGEDAL